MESAVIRNTKGPVSHLIRICRVRVPLQTTKFVVVDGKKTLDCGVSNVGKRKKRDTCVRYSVKCWCTREEKRACLCSVKCWFKKEA